jgi:hypothetical protein
MYPSSPDTSTAVRNGDVSLLSSVLMPVAAQLLERRKRHLLHPPSGSTLASEIRDMDDLLYCIDHFMSRCPPTLALDVGLLPADQTTPTALLVNAVEGDHSILATNLPMLPIPGHVPIASYQAQQANLYVTQVSVLAS